MPANKVAAEILVTGRVQGVGYRFFTERAAGRLGITGWSRNMPDGSVMLDVEGDEKAMAVFVEDLKKGPGMSRVDNVDVRWKKYDNRYTNFYIKF